MTVTLLDADPRRFKQLQLRHPPPYPHRVALSVYRKVFVTDRLENPEQPGPDNEGAALVMGNSVRQWHQSYWPTRRQSLADGAGQAMQGYREGLLQRAASVDGGA
jgi:hypothetical protein